jgi:hypothetical protein
MKQRDFVVVVFRVLAVWIAVQALLTLLMVIRQGSTMSFFAQYGLMAVVVIVLTCAIPFFLVYFIWRRSPWLMRKIYADYDLWDEYVESPVLDQATDTLSVVVEESVVTDATIDQVNLATVASELHAAPVEFDESYSAFDSRITAQDIFRVFLMGLGVWLIVETIPTAIGFVYAAIGMMGAHLTPPDWVRALTLLSELGLGWLLINPARIVGWISKIGGQAELDKMTIAEEPTPVPHDTGS